MIAVIYTASNGNTFRMMSRTTLREFLGDKAQKLSEDEWLSLINLHFHEEDYDVKINLDIHGERKMIACAIVDALRGAKRFGYHREENLFSEIFHKLFDVKAEKLIIYPVSNKPYIYV